MRRFFLALTGPVLAIACTSFGAGDGSSSGAPDAGAVIPGNDGGADATTSNDSGSTSPPSDDGGRTAAPTISCLGSQQHAFFCDDFETGTAVNTAPGAWTLAVDDDGAASIDTTGKVDGTGSLDLGFPDGTNGDALLRYTRPNGAGPLSIRFDLYISNAHALLGNDFTTEILAFFAGANEIGNLTLDTNNGSNNASIQANVGAKTGAFPLTAGAKECISILIDDDSVTVSSQNIAAAMIETAQAATATSLALGWHFEGDTGGPPLDFYFDNVVISDVAIPCDGE